MMRVVVVSFLLLHCSLGTSSSGDTDFTEVCRCLQNSTSGYYCAWWSCRTTYDNVIKCFSGQTTVRTRDRGEIPLASVDIAEEVLVFDGDKLLFEPIYDFVHVEKTQYYSFLRLTAVNQRRNVSSQVEISARHLIFIYGEDEAVFASEVKVGQMLALVDGDQIVPGEVIAVERILSQGFYAPLTPSGTIVVGGFVASNYAEIRNHHLAHIVMQPYRLWRMLVGFKRTSEDQLNWYAGVLYFFARNTGLLSLF